MKLCPSQEVRGDWTAHSIGKKSGEGRGDLPVFHHGIEPVKKTAHDVDKCAQHTLRCTYTQTTTDTELMLEERSGSSAASLQASAPLGGCCPELLLLSGSDRPTDVCV